MKTSIKLIWIACIACGAFSSCKKSYNCACTTTTGSSYITSTSTIKDTKKKAKEACESGSGSLSYGTVACVIKK